MNAKPKMIVIFRRSVLKESAFVGETAPETGKTAPETGNTAEVIVTYHSNRLHDSGRI